MILIRQLGKDKLVALTNRTDTGEDSWQPSFLKAAKDNSVRVVKLEELYGIPDLVLLSLEYDRLLHPSKFKSGSLYNIHFSYLPAYKGMYTSIWPILNGETFSGVTLHRIDPGIDTGDIINQAKFDIDINDTSRVLYSKYLENSIQLFKENYQLLLSGSVASKRQPIIGSTYYSKSSIDFKNITIDLKKTGFEIHNQVRAFCFPEYQLPSVLGIEVRGSRLLDTKSGLQSGTIIDEKDDQFTISTVDYDVLLLKSVQTNPTIL